MVEIDSGTSTQRYIKRDVEDKIIKWIDDREIIVIRGPRQCGKTTMLRRIKEILLERNVPQESVVMLDLEDPLVKIEFEKNPKAYISSKLFGKRTYFLLDEVQAMERVGEIMKLIFDSFDNIKIIMTGSSSFDLTRLGEMLVGRVIFIDMGPFSFQEFLRAKDPSLERAYIQSRFNIEKAELLQPVRLTEMNEMLKEYLLYGGFPRIVLEQNRDKKVELLNNLFITYIEKDIVSKYGVRRKDSTVTLLKTLAYNCGDVVNVMKLTEITGLKYREIRELLPLLQDSFVVRIIRPFHRNLNTELKKHPKVYFFDTGMRNFLAGSFDENQLPKLYENFVANMLHSAYKDDVKYWRTTSNSEVDFVVCKGKEVIPIEVKTAARPRRSLYTFMDEYSCKIAILPNLLNAKEEHRDGKRLLFVPFTCL